MASFIFHLGFLVVFCVAFLATTEAEDISKNDRFFPWFFRPTTDPQLIEDLRQSFPPECPGLSAGTRLPCGFCLRRCSGNEDCWRTSRQSLCCPCRSKLNGGQITQSCAFVANAQPNP